MEGQEDETRNVGLGSLGSLGKFMWIVTNFRSSFLSYAIQLLKEAHSLIIMDVSFRMLTGIELRNGAFRQRMGTAVVHRFHLRRLKQYSIRSIAHAKSSV